MNRRRGSETILLVEDCDDIRDLIRELLERHGHRVLAAANGFEALALFDQHGDETELLLCDVSLPGLSGPEVAERLLCQRPGLPMIFVSGHLDAASLIASKVKVPFAFVPKPFDPATLLHRIRTTLDDTHR